MTNLTFDAGVTLTVLRHARNLDDKLGDAQPIESSHSIGPCGIIDSRGRVNLEDDGTARWVGTVTVEVQVDNHSDKPLPDVQVGDKIRLPNGETGLVVQPPSVPRNPFTGWIPYLHFVMATPGYVPAL